ncbi:MAG: hypothetical protein BGP06_11235 [Rhizobiales bacterium 65-9]|nr:thiamine phosphate synthase [Hyphomicrobiales bacterium]OJY32894.1 MAG: hypothetical protein BGP06_11235 [Rhizobiales bacterium 65-9]
MTTKAQTYLVTPLIEDADAFAPLLSAAIRRTGAASALLRFAAGDERTIINRIKRLAPEAQALDAAVLVEEDATLATRGGADGVHVGGGIEQVRDAARRLHPGRIVGCGGLRSRHDAMEAGEAGVDYVMFGEPFLDRRGSEIAPPTEETFELAAWWAHLFETPCVAYAASPEAAEALAGTGAEFIALGPWAFAAA